MHDIPNPIDRACVGSRCLRGERPLAGQGEAGAEEQTGLKVGEQVPKFTLKDQEGKGARLDEFLGAGKAKVALVFYRSADW